MIILLLTLLLQCDPARAGLVYGWNDEWIFKAESLAGDGLPAEGAACWAVEVLDWPRYCIDQSGPVTLAPRECMRFDRDQDGNVDLVDVVMEQRMVRR